MVKESSPLFDRRPILFFWTRSFQEQRRRFPPRSMLCKPLDALSVLNSASILRDQKSSGEVHVNLQGFLAGFVLLLEVAVCSAQDQPPKTVATSLNGTWSMEESQFISAADAMPEARYSFAPTVGEFKGVRTFAEQVKHVACGNFAFFNEIEGKTPPPGCEKGGPSPAKGKAELIKYLRDSFAYANRVMNTITAQNAMQPVNGPYAAPNSRLGIAVMAVWHVADHYGQVVEYLRMNGIVPPGSRGAPAVR